MAIVQDTDNEETQSQGLEQPSLGGEQSTELSQGVSSTDPAATSGSSERKGTSSGARLQNLQKYVAANRNSGMSDKISSGMEDIRSGVESGITESQTGLQNQAAAEKSRLSQGEQLIKASQEGGKGLLEQGNTSAYTQDISPATTLADTSSTQMTGTDGVSTVTEPVAETVTTPDYSDYGSTATDRLDSFNKYKAGEIGDISIANEADLTSNIESLQNRANLAQTEAGRFQLLKETFGDKAGYNTGMQRLDQLILQAAPEEAAKLKEMSTNIANPVQAQMTALQAQRDTEQGLVGTQAQNLAANINTQLYGDGLVRDAETGQVTSVGGQLGDFNTSLADRVAAEQARSTEQFGALQNIVERGYDVTPQMLTDLGVTDADQQKQFMDYYQRGQGRTLATAAEQGGFDIDELRSIAEKTGTDYNEMKELYTGTPKSLQDFATSAGKNYNSASAANKATINSQYNNYKNNLAAQSAEYKANLEGYVGENLADLRVKGPEIDYSQYLSGLDPDQITAAKVATAEDFSRQAALEQLAGQGFGQLQQSQLGQAGTAGDLGYGSFNMSGALGAAKDKYELPTYTDLERVTAPTIGDTKTIGEQVQDTTEATTESVIDGIADPLQEYTGTGGVTNSVALDPSKTYVDQTTKGLTTPMTDAELSAGRLMEGDIAGTNVELALAPTIGGVQAGAAPISALEKQLTGGDKIGGVANDYSDALKGLTYGDFDATKDALVSTYKLPKQLTEDAAKKVASILSESTKAVSNTWKTATKTWSKVKKFFSKW